MLRVVVLVVAVGLIGFAVPACTKSEPVAESAACCTNEATPTATEPASAATNTVGTTPGFVASDLRVSGRQTRDGVVLSVQNHAELPVKLKSSVRIERRASDDRWLPVAAPGFALRFSCEAAADTCVSLAPGAELLPPLWPATQGRGACGACEQCPAIAAGAYRFVIDACEGSASVASAEFAVTP